jgi:hypothetical protein
MARSRTVVDLDVISSPQKLLFGALDHQRRWWRGCNVFEVVWTQPLAEEGVDTQEALVRALGVAAGGRHGRLELGNASGDTGTRLETPQIGASMYHDPVAALLGGQWGELRALLPILRCVGAAPILSLFALVQQGGDAQPEGLRLSPATVSKGRIEGRGRCEVPVFVGLVKSGAVSVTPQSARCRRGEGAQVVKERQ